MGDSLPYLDNLLPHINISFYFRSYVTLFVMLCPPCVVAEYSSGVLSLKYTIQAGMETPNAKNCITSGMMANQGFLSSP